MQTIDRPFPKRHQGRMLVYKIFRADEWDRLLEKGYTHGTAVDLQDGYIHLSTGAQLAETGRKHFAGEDGLVLAMVDSEDFGDAIRWEPSRGGQLFPHLYKKLRLCDILWHKTLERGPDGELILPEGVQA